MTGTTNLLADCHACGIRLALTDSGELEIDAPADALTPDLLRRLRNAKPNLAERLAIQWADTGGGEADTALLVACDEWAELVAESSDAAPIGPDGWSTDCVDPEELTPCPTCQGADGWWQAAAGDPFGHSPPRWRCLRCDPPAAARRLAKATERIRRSARTKRPNARRTT